MSGRFLAKRKHAQRMVRRIIAIRLSLPFPQCEDDFEEAFLLLKLHLKWYIRSLRMQRALCEHPSDEDLFQLDILEELNGDVDDIMPRDVRILRAHGEWRLPVKPSDLEWLSPPSNGKLNFPRGKACICDCCGCRLHLRRQELLETKFEVIRIARIRTC